MTDVLDPEELFPPRAGGMVDTVRRQRRGDQDQAAALADAAPAPGRAKVDVPVKEPACEFARARTYSVSTGGPNPVVELLGADPNRRYAVLLAVDQPVVISFSQTAAEDPRNAVNASGLSANGFVLPVGVPVPANTASVIYCTATSATAGRVSVMAFSYPET